MLKELTVYESNDGVSVEKERVETPYKKTRKNKVKGKTVNAVTVKSLMPTGKTPQRGMKRQIESGKSDHVVVERWQNCLGRPVQFLDDKGDTVKMVCQFCNKHRTSYKCIICHGWFCTTANSDATVCSVRLKTKDGEPYKTLFVDSCFHKKHSQAWKEREENERN